MRNEYLEKVTKYQLNVLWCLAIGNCTRQPDVGWEWGGGSPSPTRPGKGLSYREHGIFYIAMYITTWAVASWLRETVHLRKICTFQLVKYDFGLN